MTEIKNLKDAENEALRQVQNAYDFSKVHRKNTHILESSENKGNEDENNTSDYYHVTIEVRNASIYFVHDHLPITGLDYITTYNGNIQFRILRKVEKQ